MCGGSVHSSWFWPNCSDVIKRKKPLFCKTPIKKLNDSGFQSEYELLDVAFSFFFGDISLGVCVLWWRRKTLCKQRDKPVLLEECDLRWNDDQLLLRNNISLSWFTFGDFLKIDMMRKFFLKSHIAFHLIWLKNKKKERAHILSWNTTNCLASCKVFHLDWGVVVALYF